MSPHIGYVPIT